MHSGAGRDDGDALAAQDADADEIADRSLDSIIGGEVAVLVDLLRQLADRQLRWMLCENYSQYGPLGSFVLVFGGAVLWARARVSMHREALFLSVPGRGPCQRCPGRLSVVGEEARAEAARTCTCRGYTIAADGSEHLFALNLFPAEAQPICRRFVFVEGCHADRPPFEVKDGYDVQDLIEGVLRAIWRCQRAPSRRRIARCTIRVSAQQNPTTFEQLFEGHGTQAAKSSAKALMRDRA